MVDGKNIVLLSMVGSAGIVVVSDVQDSGSINGTHLLALGIVSVGMTAAADTVPKVAVPLSLLILFGIMLSKGAKVFGKLANRVSSPPANPVASNSTVSATGVVVPPRQRVRTTGPSDSVSANRHR